MPTKKNMTDDEVNKAMAESRAYKERRRARKYKNQDITKEGRDDAAAQEYQKQRGRYESRGQTANANKKTPGVRRSQKVVK